MDVGATSSLELIAIPMILDTKHRRKDCLEEGSKLVVEVPCRNMGIVTEVITVNVIPREM